MRAAAAHVVAIGEPVALAVCQPERGAQRQPERESVAIAQRQPKQDSIAIANNDNRRANARSDGRIDKLPMECDGDLQPLESVRRAMG